MPKKLRFSIKLHITTLFISLILVLGGVLAWFNYLKVSEILINTSSRIFDQLSNEVTDAIENNYYSVTSNIKLLAETDLPKTTNYEERERYESAMVAILDNNLRVAAISLGYPDGDYFIIRSIISTYMREKFSAPENARFMVDHIESDAPSRQIRRKFIDNKLNLIGEVTYLDTEYNPAIRPWFTQAQTSTKPVTTAPYLFYFIGKVGQTISYEDKDSGAVIAADITLDELSRQLSNTYITPSSHILLIDKENKLIAYQNIDKVLGLDKSGNLKQSSVSDLYKPEIKTFLSLTEEQVASGDIEIERSFSADGRNWFGKMTEIPMSESEMFLIVLSPESELLTEATSIRNSSTMITAIILFLSLPLTWILAIRVAKPLIALTDEAEKIKDLDFRPRKTARSFVTEIDELSISLNSMQRTINQFIKLVNIVTSEQEHEKLLTTVTKETRRASNARSVAIYLCNDEKNMLTQASVNNESPTSTPDPIAKAYPIQDQPSVIQSAIERHSIQTNDYTLGRTQHPNLIDDLLLFSELTIADVVAIPLLDRKQDLTGVVVMIFERHSTTEAISENKVTFAEALAGFCAESLEKNRLYNDQKQLLESFIKLIAGAIDAKSPYTGGHCQRVPELAKLLTQAACDDTDVFKDFNMSDEEWEALHIASWLHDCGKVTTPEYVVDKATRLETIYNRIHEIRTRFEVLKRDALIDHHQRRATLAQQGKLDDVKEQALQSELTQTLETLDKEFAFIAECNSGDKFMDQNAVTRLNEIAERTWQRTLNDRIGLSWEERKRKEATLEQSLPVTEKLLDNRADHLIPRESTHLTDEDNPWGFKMNTPNLKFNLGEIYNLSARAGTLTEEERFIINDHIIQTIVMLDKLPFPNHLKDVPDIAGNHHERMDGKGYPRRRNGDEMSLQSKVMAIADIFEALTACDRPYKEAKPLSSALFIMKNMANEGHIDPELFKLFIRSGVYKVYANKFLSPEQIDSINESEFI